MIKEFKIEQVDINRLISNNYNQRGENNNNWKGGQIIGHKGYILIHKPEHPNSNSLGYIREHRYLYEIMLGRYLKSGEIVHHIDGDKTNNDPMNLQLMTHGEHSSITRKKELAQGKILFGGVTPWSKSTK